MSSIHSLKLIAKTPENTPQKEGLIFQPSIFRGKLAVNFREGSYKWNLYEFTTPINGLRNGFPWIYFTPKIPVSTPLRECLRVQAGNQPFGSSNAACIVPRHAFHDGVRLPGEFLRILEQKRNPKHLKMKETLKFRTNARNFSGKLIKHHLFSKEQKNNLALWDLPK